MKKVLVTGANGFIGRQALPLLVQEEYEVHAVSHEASDIKMKNVTWHSCDLLNENARAELIKSVQPTHVLHFAWIATPGEYWTSPLNEEWKEATLDLLRLAKENGAKRFVTAGTCAEYDWSTGVCSEESPLRCETPYTKAKHETYEAMMKENDISTAWGRIFLLYGPHEYPNRLVSSIILSLLKDEKAECTHGEQIRDFLHVKDVASAFVSLLQSDVQGAINIGSGIPVSIKEIATIIGKLMGKEELIDLGARSTPKNDPRKLVADTKKLHQEVGWKPSISLEDGLKETIEWWRNNM